MPDLFTPQNVLLFGKVVVPLSMFIIFVRYATTVTFRDTIRHVVRHPFKATMSHKRK